MATRRRATTKAAAPAPVEADDAFEELDDVDETEDEAPAPTRGRKAAKAAAAPAKDGPAELGSVWLAEYLTENIGREFDSRSVRMLLRKAARDEDGPLAREIGEDRSRYVFKGPNDPVVKYIVKLAKTPRPVRAPKAETEQVEETPKPTRTRAAKSTAPAKATPAKATTRTRRRTAAATEE